MRYLVLATFVLAGSTAQAQSLTPLATNTHGSSSMVVKTCDGCPPLLDPSDKEGAYRVPVLKDGVQSVAVIEIDGEKKIARTEAWMGGSPVIYLSNVPAWMTGEQLQAAIRSGNSESIEADVRDATEQQDPIDFGARTGAVESEDASSAMKDVPLRLN